MDARPSVFYGDLRGKVGVQIDPPLLSFFTNVGRQSARRELVPTECDIPFLPRTFLDRGGGGIFYPPLIFSNSDILLG